MIDVDGVVISDEVQEAIYDATDLYGVCEFSLDLDIRNVIYVVGVSSKSLHNMEEAACYLNNRCPDFVWVACLQNWVRVNNEALLYSCSSWYNE